MSLLLGLLVLIELAIVSPLLLFSFGFEISPRVDEKRLMSNEVENEVNNLIESLYLPQWHGLSKGSGAGAMLFSSSVSSTNGKFTFSHFFRKVFFQMNDIWILLKSEEERKTLKNKLSMETTPATRLVPYSHSDEVC